MGINFGIASLLAQTDLIGGARRRSGSDSCKVLMLGRQTMSTDVDDYRCLSITNGAISRKSVSYGEFAEPFLTDLGATGIVSLDVSAFEAATIQHNLSLPATANLDMKPHLGGYDIVFDYGTSEHVFSPAQSILNAFSFVKTGGYYNCALPVCGWLEHGLYQFSPTFFHSLESEAFRLERMYILDPYSKPLRLWDGMSLINIPYYERLRGRYSCWAVYRKVDDFDEAETLASTQQASYRKAWKGEGNSAAGAVPRRGFATTVKSLVVNNTWAGMRLYMWRKRLPVDGIATFD